MSKQVNNKRRDQRCGMDIKHHQDVLLKTSKQNLPDVVRKCRKVQLITFFDMFAMSSESQYSVSVRNGWSSLRSSIALSGWDSTTATTKGVNDDSSIIYLAKLYTLTVLHIITTNIYSPKTTRETSQVVEKRPRQILEQHDLAEDSTRQANLEKAC